MGKCDSDYTFPFEVSKIINAYIEAHKWAHGDINMSVMALSTAMGS